jgi:hypothetical protein
MSILYCPPNYNATVDCLMIASNGPALWHIIVLMPQNATDGELLHSPQRVK